MDKTLNGLDDRRLALGMLETATGFGLARFFAFHHTRVARHEAFLAESRAESGVHFHESASDAELNGAGLAGDAAAEDGDMKIESGGTARVLESGGGFGTGPKMAAEVIVYGFIVDKELAGALHHANASDAFFATACGPNGK